MSNEPEPCFYCGALVSRAGKNRGDHFPVPERNGGNDIVPCCESCHDMKDRFNLESWPTDWVVAVIGDFPKMSRETRLFLAKAIDAFSDASKRIKEAAQ